MRQIQANLHSRRPKGALNPPSPVPDLALTPP
jgi:hypothetical protein